MAQPLASLAAPPVPLTQFTATADGLAVRLAWTTAQEKNSAAVQVERSTNGQQFAVIGRVAAGSSTTPHRYALTDAVLPVGAPLLYYRLRAVDQDGTLRTPRCGRWLRPRRRPS